MMFGLGKKKESWHDRCWREYREAPQSIIRKTVFEDGSEKYAVMRKFWPCKLGSDGQTLPFEYRLAWYDGIYNSFDEAKKELDARTVKETEDIPA